MRLKTLSTDSRLLGIKVFGYVSTIKTVTMVNTLDAVVENTFALIDVFSFLVHCAEGSIRDSLYIVSMLLPLIKSL